MATDNLLQEFPPVTTQSWEDAIAGDLKGADYLKKLIWQTEEGLAVKPYYRSEDLAALELPDVAPGVFPYLRSSRTTGDWRIREEIWEWFWSACRRPMSIFKPPASRSFVS